VNAKPNATLSGTVEMIIKSPLASEPERAQIAVEEADHSYMQIRIKNTDRRKRRRGPLEAGCQSEGYGSEQSKRASPDNEGRLKFFRRPDLISHQEFCGRYQGARGGKLHPIVRLRLRRRGFARVFSARVRRKLFVTVRLKVLPQLRRKFRR